MAALYEVENVEMQVLTQKYVSKLTSIWMHIFDQDTCKDNLRKLVDHATTFYEELVAESLEKQDYIQKEISELQEEADTLRRLLKTNVELSYPVDANTPLLVIQSEMDKSLTELRECLRQRREQICELLLEQEALCDELGEPPRPLLADPLPTAEEIDEFREHLIQLKEERVQRTNQLSILRREIKNFLQVLEVHVNTEIEDRLLNHRQIKLNKDTFVDLQRMHDRYSSQVQQLHDQINCIRKKVETLWERLSTSPGTRNKYKRFTEYTQYTHDMLYGELQRCESLKSQNIKQFVQQIRQEILEWWDKTLKSDVQRSRFSNFNSKCYTDDLLVLHEMELEDLKQFYESNHQIFELYSNRKILWERMTALEAKALEPGRYNNRGGQLLKEEKERKTIATKLPNIEQQITELVHEYERREHTPFLIYGENILDMMASEWEKKRQEKEKHSSARKNARTPLSNSQYMPTRTPLSAKNGSSTLSLRKATSANNLSSLPLAVSTQKRKLTAAEKPVPVAKRSLLHALSSPSVFLKPSCSSVKKTPFKSPLKRVIATTIRRRSGRRSANAKKRRSQQKVARKPTPKIVISGCYDSPTDDGGSDDNYDSFEKYIEPASRSSVIEASMLNATTRAKRIQQIATNENLRLAQLPKPRIMRTPSKRAGIPIVHSPARGNSSRKMTTKNLPIMI